MVTKPLNGILNMADGRTTANIENLCFGQQQCLGGVGNWRTFPENTVEDDTFFFAFSSFPCELRLCEKVVLF